MLALFKFNSLKFVYCLFIAWGILPFTIDFSHQRTCHSRLLLFYKHSVAIIVICLYTVVSVEAILALYDSSIYNSTSIIITSIEMTMNQFLLLATNVTIYQNRSNIVTLFSNISDLRPDTHKIRQLVLRAFVTTFLIFDGHLIAGVLSFGSKIAQYRLQIAIFVLYYPNLHLLCINTLYYAGCKVLKLLIEQLNSEISTKVWHFKQQYAIEKLMHRKIELSLQMSEFVDVWYVRSMQLNELFTGLIRIFKTFLLMALNVSFLVVVNQIFYMYVRFLNMRADQDLAGTMVFVAQALLCLFHTMGIFLTIDASDDLINECVYYFFLILGVVPFGCNFHQQRCFASRTILAWKCAVTLTAMIFYPSSMQTIATRVDMTKFHLATQVVASSEQLLALILVASSAVCQLYNLEKLLSCMQNFFEIRDMLHTIRPLSLSGVFKSSLVLFCIGWLLAIGPMCIEFFVFALTTQISDLLALLNLYYPDMILLGLNCVFYAGTSSIQCMVEHLNGIVQTQVQSFIQEYGAETLVHRRLLKCCQMSEFCDMASRLHHELMELGRLFGAVFNGIILFTINFSILQVVNQLFYAYTLLIRRAELTNDFSLLSQLWFSIFHSLQICSIIISNNSLKVEKKKIGLILHQIRFPDLDIRLRNSIESFSLQFLQQPAANICGMFALDYTTLYSMIASGTSYLIILIQFELTSPNYANKLKVPSIQ